MGGQCIFCSIVAGKSKSFKIDEDKDNIAILELNPLSEGHSLIIQKSHSKEISEQTKAFAQSVTNKIEQKLKPNEIKINQIEIMEHGLLEIVPIYENETEKHAASEEELEQVKEKITKPEKEIKIEEEKPEIPEAIKIPQLPPRIP